MSKRAIYLTDHEIDLAYRAIVFCWDQAEARINGSIRGIDNLALVLLRDDMHLLAPKFAPKSAAQECGKL